MSDEGRPGTPEAGPVRVYRIDPETGEKVLVREEEPQPADLRPGETFDSMDDFEWEDDEDEDEWTLPA